MESFDDTFLARWVADELSAEELLEFKKSKYYLDYKKINEGAKALEVPSFDGEAILDGIYGSLQDKATKPKVVRMMPNWVYGAAAAVIVAFGVFLFKNNNTEYETGFGEQVMVVLPDDSKVHLNANSTLEFNKGDWESNRVLDFDGEAFFDVEKGSIFKVNSKEGIVEVLGTEFNVVSREGYMEVKCHEGKVKVSMLGGDRFSILTEGKALRLIDNKEEKWEFKEEKPSWMTGESSFRETPLSQVIRALENQYEIGFNTSKVDLNKRYTGSFIHSDLNLALRTVFGPMNISYSQEGSNTIVLK